jgi:hypothetical protein
MIIPKNKVEDFIQEKKHKYFFISGKHEGTTEEVIFLLDDLNSLQAHGVHYVFEKREYYDCLGETCPFCKNGDNWMKVKYFIPIYFPAKNYVSLFPLSPQEVEKYLVENFGDDAPIKYVARITRNSRDADFAYTINIVSRPMERTVAQFESSVGIDPNSKFPQLLSPVVTSVSPPPTYVPPTPPVYAPPVSVPPTPSTPPTPPVYAPPTPPVSVPTTPIVSAPIVPPPAPGIVTVPETIQHSTLPETITAPPPPASVIVPEATLPNPAAVVGIDGFNFEVED